MFDHARVWTIAHFPSSRDESLPRRDVERQLWSHKNDVIKCISYFDIPRQCAYRFAEITDNSNRAKAFALMPVTFSVGVAIGPFIGGPCLILNKEI
jgi:hypothetical protein